MSFLNKIFLYYSLVYLKNKIGNISLLSEERKFLNSNLTIPATQDRTIQLNISDNVVRFFVIADWGGTPTSPYRTRIQGNVAKFIQNYTLFKNIHFKLALGDNFYYKGVKSVNDKRFKQTFENVFIEQNVPWFFILGNHDHLGNAYSQIEYTSKSKRWIMPDFNYSISVNSNNGNNKLVYILLLDTVLLCGNLNDENNKKNKVEISELRVLNELEQIEEILKNVSNQGYPYVIVAGHYPIWSVSKHGPTKCLVDHLRPLLHKYKVNAYFSGHDHNMQHLSDIYLNTTVEYIVTGAASILYNSKQNSKDVPKGSLKFYWSDTLLKHGAVALVEADMNFMNISFLKTNDKLLYKISIKNKFKN